MNLIKKFKTPQNGHKIAFLGMALLTFSTDLFAISENDGLSSKAIDGGIGLGSIVAVVASWSRNKSILWAVIHGLLGWIYVVYFVFTRSED